MIQMLKMVMVAAVSSLALAGVSHSQDNDLANDLLSGVADRVLNCGDFYSAIVNVKGGASDGWRIYSSGGPDSSWTLVETLTIRSARGSEVSVRSNFNDGRSDILRMRIQPDKSIKLLSRKFVDYRCRNQSSYSWSAFKRRVGL